MSAETASPQPDKSTHPAFDSPAFRQLVGALSLILTISFVGYFVLPWLTAERGHQSESHGSGESTALVNVDEATPEAVVALYTDLTRRVADLLRQTNNLTRATERISVEWGQIHNEIESLQSRVDQLRSEEDAAQAKASWARDAAKKAMVDLASLLKELEIWESDILPLLTNETGRRIATDDQRVELVAQAFTRRRPDVTQVREWMDELLSLLQVYADAESVSLEDRDEIKAIADSAATSVRELKADREQVEVIIESVRRSAAGETTLEAALKPHR